MTVLEFAYTKNRKNYWKCQCECGNICYVSTAQLTTGETVSCGRKNDENRANLPNLDRGLVDRTMKAAIQKDRTRNKNNASGVHFDSKRGLWVAQISLGQINLGHNDGKLR